MKQRITIATGAHGCIIADTVDGDLTYYDNGSTRTQWAAAACSAASPKKK